MRSIIRVYISDISHFLRKMKTQKITNTAKMLYFLPKNRYLAIENGFYSDQLQKESRKSVFVNQLVKNDRCRLFVTEYYQK